MYKCTNNKMKETCSTVKIVRCSAGRLGLEGLSEQEEKKK